MKKNLLILLTLFVFAACGPVDRHRHTKQISKVKVYKEKSTIIDQDPNNDFIFWYIMQLDGGSYSYYSSSAPVSNLSTVNWTQSSSLPPQLANGKLAQMEEQEEQEVETDVDADGEGGTVSESEGEGEGDGDGGGDSGGDGGGGDGGGGGD